MLMTDKKCYCLIPITSLFFVFHPQTPQGGLWIYQHMLAPPWGGWGVENKGFMLRFWQIATIQSEKKSLFLRFLYIPDRYFSVMNSRAINFQNCFCKIKSIL